MLYVNMYLEEFCRKYNKNIKSISDELVDTFIKYNWPGNVREMKNIIEYLANIVDTGKIQTTDLPSHILLGSEQGYHDWSLERIMEEHEKRVLGSMIRKNATLAEKNELAAALKISRATLYRKLQKYDLL